MATKHGKVVTYRESLAPINSHDPLNMPSRDKLKTLYFSYHKAYSLYQTCQSGDIPREASNHKFE